MRRRASILGFFAIVSPLALASCGRIEQDASAGTSPPTLVLADAGDDALDTSLSDARLADAEGPSCADATSASAVETPDAVIDDAPTPDLGFRAAAAMPTPRTGQLTFVLEDGRLLVVGGAMRSGLTIQDAYAYEPIADAWTFVARLPDAASENGSPFARARLGSHPVVFSHVGHEVVPFELDVASGTFARRAPLPTALGERPAIAQLTDGRWFAAATNGPLNYAYDPKTDVWSEVARSLHDHVYPYVYALTDGRVVTFDAIAPGEPQSRVAIYNPVVNRWTSASSMPDKFEFAPWLGGDAVALADGRLIVPGISKEPGGPANDYQPTPFATLDPDCGTWSMLPWLPRRALHERGVVLPSGRVLWVNVASHYPTAFNFTANPTAVLDVTTGRWDLYAPLDRAGSLFYSPSVDLLPSGVVVIAGGSLACGATCPPRPVADVWRLDHLP